ncbi:MAG: glycosyltransferase family 9 protein [Verrucomicrobia bacterium]|nr:glycosyltransferase family 9 protein [Verrucomicrobiota bacterium]
MPDTHTDSKPPRVLVLRSGAIGDFVVTLPVLQWLRLIEPRSVIDLACHPRVAPLAHGLVSRWRDIESTVFLPLYHDSHVEDPVLQGFLGNYDLVLSFLGSDTTPAQRLRELTSERAACIDPIPRHNGLHVTASFFEQMRLAGLRTPDTDEAAHILPVIQPDEDRHRLAAALLDELGPGAGRTLIALHPGSGSPRKNAPAGVLAEVCAWLIEALEDAADRTPALVFVKGEADEEAVARLFEHIDPATPLVETHDLGVLAAVLERCALFVGHDSGVSHIAAAVGTPTVAVFVSTDPRVWAPRGVSVALAEPTSTSIRAAVVSLAER